MKKLVMFCLFAVALAAIVGGCDLISGSSNPLLSQKKHDVSVSGSQMTVKAAIDDGALVNVVENGKPAYVSAKDVTTVIWNGPHSGWYPGGGARVGFNASSSTISVPAHESGGQICFLAKGRVLWMNTDFVAPHGITVDASKGLLSY